MDSEGIAKLEKEFTKWVEGLFVVYGNVNIGALELKTGTLIAETFALIITCPKEGAYQQLIDEAKDLIKEKVGFKAIWWRVKPKFKKLNNGDIQLRFRIFFDQLQEAMTNEIKNVRIITDVTNSITLNIPTDLSDIGYEAAVDMLNSNDVQIIERTLIVSPCDAVMAGRLADEYQLSVIVLPILKSNSWALIGRYVSVCSDGS